MKSVALLPIVVVTLMIDSVSAGAAARSGGAAPLATVGGDTLTIATLDGELSATLAESKGNIPTLDPDAVLKRLIQNRLLEQEGYRTGADRTPEVQNQVREFIRLKAVRALLDTITALGSPKVVVDADSLLGQAGTLRRYSHILVKDEALAAALRDTLSRGGVFADLARRHSIDGTASSGGDLGWQGEGAYVEEFEAAAAHLAMNQISAPVKTKFGWHLITLTGVEADSARSRAMAQSLAEEREQQQDHATIDRYVDSLRTACHVTVNDALLKTLEYQSKDPAVQKSLATSEAVLAVLPTGKYTVRSLTRNIQFKYFHGLADRANAAEIRDRMFQDWVTEGLLTWQSRQLKLDHDSGLLAKAKLEERRLVREQALSSILGSDVKPSDPEIQAYYTAHQKDFVPSPRVKVFSVQLKDGAAAKRMRQQMDSGAALKFLAGRSPAGIDSIPPFPTGWIDAGILGSKDLAIAQGTPIGPLETPAGSVLAQITEVERPAPRPLAECRDEVTRAVRGEHYRGEIHEALSRLEAATAIRILPDAREMVASRIERLHASRTEERAHE